MRQDRQGLHRAANPIRTALFARRCVRELAQILFVIRRHPDMTLNGQEWILVKYPRRTVRLFAQTFDERVYPIGTVFDARNAKVRVAFEDAVHNEARHGVVNRAITNDDLAEQVGFSKWRELFGPTPRRAEHGVVSTVAEMKRNGNVRFGEASPHPVVQFVSAALVPHRNPTWETATPRQGLVHPSSQGGHRDFDTTAIWAPLA